MIIMTTELLTLCDRLVGAGINGVCQGVIVAAVVWLGLRALGRTNAATRHAAWFCALVLLVCLMVAHGALVFFPGAYRASRTESFAPFATRESETAGDPPARSLIPALE